MVALVTFGLIVFSYVTIKRGHKHAVEKSEASLRNKGLSPESKKLMREACYNV